MILSKDTRKVIDTLLTYDEDLPNRFYSVSMLEKKISGPVRVMDILEDMGEKKLIRWGDKEHTGFRLLESGRSYKEIQGLENRDRWKERLIGFVSGALITVIAWVLSLMVW